MCLVPQHQGGDVLEVDHQLGITDSALALYQGAKEMAQSPVENVRRVWGPYSQSCLVFFLGEAQKLAKLLPAHLPRSSIHVNGRVYRCDAALSRLDCRHHGWSQPLCEDPGPGGPCLHCLTQLVEDAPALLAKAESPSEIAA